MRARQYGRGWRYGGGGELVRRGGWWMCFVHLRRLIHLRFVVVRDTLRCGVLHLLSLVLRAALLLLHRILSRLCACDGSDLGVSCGVSAQLHRRQVHAQDTRETWPGSWVIYQFIKALLLKQ